MSVFATMTASIRLKSATFLSLLALLPAVSQAGLMDEVRANHEAAAMALLQSSTKEVNQRMADDTTPLHWAVYNGNLNLVHALLSAGAAVNVQNDYGATPMSEAGTLGRTDILQALLDAGGDVESPTREKQTVLMSVVRTPNIASAELLLRHGANPNAAETWRGQTALMFASAQSQPLMVQLLLDAGANPDAVSNFEAWDRQVTNEPRPQSRPLGALTALLFAAREGCVDCARYLIEGGASINQVDPNGITPLLMATLNARWDVAAYLIEESADVNRWDTWGRAPLYSTVDYNTVPRGGRPDRPSLDATTPVEVARMLLEKGANPNMQLKVFPPYRSLGNDRGGDSMLTTGTTPLIRAAKAGDIEMVSLLLEYGALPDLKNWPGYTPMLAVAGVGSSTIDIRARFRDEQAGINTAGLLLAAGADVNRGEDQGRRPIHGAVQWGWLDFIQFLAGAGADLNVEDNNGYSALDYALGQTGGTGRFAANTQVNEEAAALLVSLGAKAGSHKAAQ